MITIVDYHMGNILSIKNMLKKIGVESEITSDANKIANASKLILPGVGSFSTAMKNIEEMGLLESLNHTVLVKKTPILGICLGMQLMCNYSEEGNVKGLGWINAEVRKFPSVINDQKLRVPHIGWGQVLGNNQAYTVPNEVNRFYFVHSYFVDLADKSQQLFSSSHGVEFCSAFIKQNILGVQFHPEKSHKFGMHLLMKFSLDS